MTVAPCCFDEVRSRRIQGYRFDGFSAAGFEFDHRAAITFDEVGFEGSHRRLARWSEGESLNDVGRLNS